MTLSTTMSWDENVIEELKKGNRVVLKGLPPVLVLKYGQALQNELLGIDYKTPSPIDDKQVNQAVLEHLKDTGIKTELMQRIEAENKALMKR